MAKQTLKTLVRLARFNVDERRKELNAFLTEGERLDALLQQLEDEKLKQDDFVTLNPDPNSTFTYWSWLKKYEEDKKALEAKIAANNILVEEARVRLEDAFMELKTYEISKENKDNAYKKELEDKQQKELDDRKLNKMW